MSNRPLVPDLSPEVVTVGEFLNRQVELLQAAHERGDRVAGELIRATARGEATVEELLASELTLELVRLAIARDHGYADWSAARVHAADPVDVGFEHACDAIQWGELEELEVLLDDRPELVRARSPFHHRATLLHHAAANGIEVERQIQSPANAPEITRLLLARGAEPDAICDVYGDRDTTLVLLVSSSVPAVAGTQAPLVEVLCGGGARVDGLDDDGLPLWTAIMFGYTKAAEALERFGARVDNIVFAAALGRLDAVDGFFDTRGSLVPDRAPSAERFGRDGPALEPERLIDYALIYAALHGRREVAELLLGKDPDLSFAEPFFHGTARGAARYAGHDDIVALLDAAAT